VSEAPAFRPEVVRPKYPGDRDRQEAVQHDFLESDRIKTFDPAQDARLLPEIAKKITAPYRPYLPMSSPCSSTCPFIACSSSSLFAPVFRSSFASRAYTLKK
jgi:hypothetical protein